MSWNEVDDKLKKGIDAKFVSCQEDYELTYIREAIQGAFPALSTATINDAIDHCCRSIKAPRPRKEFVECLKKQLA